MNTPSANKEVVQAYFNCLKTGDFERLGQLFSDDVIWHQPGQGQLSKTYRGKLELFALFGQFMEISGGTFKIDEVKSIMVNGDLVSAVLHFSASNGDKAISMTGVDLMKIKNDKIQEVWLFSDDQLAEDAFWVK